MKLFPSSLAARITIGVLVMVAVSTVVLLFVEISRYHSRYLNERRIHREGDIKAEEMSINRTIDALCRDTLFMADVPPVSGIMRTELNHGYDARDGDTRAKWENRLQGIFSSFLTAHPEYYSVRYIGVAGHEIVRVENHSGKIVISPPIQAKDYHDYLKIGLREGQVYLSEFNLSQGNSSTGRISTLHAITPVYTTAGEMFGVVVISMDVGSMLKSVLHDPSGAKKYITNENGQYLADSDSKRVFLLEPGGKNEIVADFPFIQKMFDLKAPDYLPLQTDPTKSDGSLFAARRIHFDHSNPERFLLSMDYQPGVEQEFTSTTARILIYEFMTMLLVGAIAWYVLKRAFSPLQQIAAASDEIAAGEHYTPLPQMGSGEIGSLTKALNTMLASISQREQLLLRSENKYRMLLENIPQKIFYKDTSSVYVSCNKHFADDFGIKPEEIAGETDYDLFPAELADKYREDDNRLMTKEESEDTEEQYILNGKNYCVRMVRTPVVDVDGKVSGILGIFWDITAYKHAGNMLRLHSEVLNHLSEGVFLIRASDSLIVYTNQQLKHMFGYEPGELIGLPMDVLYAPGALSAAISDELHSSGEWCGEIQCIRKDGTIFLCHTRTSAFNHAQYGRIWVSICEDITERKQAERQLLELGMHLQSVIEEERTRIARELHDELGQSMTALRFDLKWLFENIDPQKGDAHEKLQDINNLVGRTVDSIRRISEDLRPGILDDIGLAAAVENHVAKFQQQSGIGCDLFVSNVDFDLDNQVATALFRLIQEALTNVARHSGASHVIIRLLEADDNILLIVQDNGCGLPPADNRRKKTFGLLGMRERVKMLGGTLDIFNMKGAGVQIEACVPKHIKETR